MRQRIALPILLMLAVTALVIRAQAEDETIIRSKPLLVVTPSAFEAAVSSGHVRYAGNTTKVALDLLIGLPVGVRLKLPTINFTDKSRLVLEGVYGGLASTMGIAEVKGGGVRIQLNITQDSDANDALFISPGVDLLVLSGKGAGDRSWIDFNPYSDVYLLTGTVDVAYVHEFAKHFGLEVGAQLGGGISLKGMDSSNQDSKGKLTPIFSLFTGMRF